MLRCDHFDVGRAQESGRCWGDALVIYGDSNSVLRNRKHSRKIDHLSLCGRYFHLCMFLYSSFEIRVRIIFGIDIFLIIWYRRDGFEIRAVADEDDEITIKFKTGNDVQKSGFSCLVSTHPKGTFIISM